MVNLVDRSAAAPTLCDILAQLWVRYEEWPDCQVVDVAQEECPDGIFRSANDGLFMHIETGVDDSRDSRAQRNSS